MLIKWAFVVTIFVMLVGCAPQPPGPPQAVTVLSQDQIGADMSAFSQEMGYCELPIAQDNKYAALGVHMPLWGDFDDAQPTQLNSGAKISRADEILLADRWNRLVPCMETYTNELTTLSPSLSQPDEHFYELENQETELLASDKITWGTFVTVMALHSDRRVKAEELAFYDLLVATADAQDESEAQPTINPWEAFGAGMLSGHSFADGLSRGLAASASADATNQ